MEEVTYVAVQFDNTSKAYHYKTTEEFKKGDYAVVKTSSGLTLVRVFAADCDIVPKEGIKYKWIVGKVVMSKERSS